MVDKEDVYLNVKLKYKNKIKEISSKDLLTIDEIKTKINEFFFMKKCKFEDLELYCAKNNEKIVKDEDLIFLPEEISEYKYAIEIDVINKLDKKKEEMEKLQNDIKDLEEKIKILKCKKKMQIKHNKDKMKIKKEIQNQIRIKKKRKYLNDLKNKIINDIMEGLDFNNKYNDFLKQINGENQKELDINIDILINYIKDIKKLSDEEFEKSLKKILNEQFQEKNKNFI